MSNYSETEFCNPDDGLDYIFGRMGAIYGAAFIRHWDGVDPELIRQVWKEELGRFLTYRPSMDYAMGRLNADFPPSAIAFKNFCNAGPMVPRKPHSTLEYQKPETVITEEGKRKGMADLNALKQRWKVA